MELIAGMLAFVLVAMWLIVRELGFIRYETKESRLILQRLLDRDVDRQYGK
jgi:hypothetical protein